MNDTFLADLSWSSKILISLPNGSAASFAYERLEVHRRAASTQMRRIWEAAAASRSANEGAALPQTPIEQRDLVESARARHEPLLYEIHFYFVAIYACGNMLTALTGHPELRAAKKIFDAHRREFEHYAAGRHSFEHFRERFPGAPNAKAVRDIQPNPRAGPYRIFFGFENGSYMHSDTTWDITPGSFERFNRIIASVLESVRDTLT